MHRNRHQSIALSVLASLAVLVTGCSNERPMGDVQGSVTINGESLAEGSIRFIPMNGETQATGGAIQGGKFHVQVPVAKQRVEIAANVIDQEKTPPNATADEIVMKHLVPDRYNLHSELTLDVTPGLNEPAYNLTNP